MRRVAAILVSWIFVSSMVLIVPTIGLADDNAQTVLALHAVVSDAGVCGIEDPCGEGRSPNVEVEVGARIAVYLLLYNYHAVAGVQTAFEWQPWTFLFGIWDSCRGNQVVGTTPREPGGVLDGTLTTAFDCIGGGTTAVVGILHFLVTAPGCLLLIDSDLPFGTHIVDHEHTVTPVFPENRGTICAGHQGVDACVPITTRDGRHRRSPGVHSLPDSRGKSGRSLLLDPHPCDPPSPAGATTWGLIKSLHR